MSINPLKRKRMRHNLSNSNFYIHDCTKLIPIDYTYDRRRKKLCQSEKSPDHISIVWFIIYSTVGVNELNGYLANIYAKYDFSVLMF